MRMQSITETVAADHREARRRQAIVRALQLQAKRARIRLPRPNFEGKLRQDVSFPSKFGGEFGGEGREITSCIVCIGG